MFALVLHQLRQPRGHLFIALDLEYVAHASTDVRHRPMSNGDWYEHLRTYVNRADVLQIGLALAFEVEEDHPVRGGEVVADSSQRVIAVEINLHFDVQSRDYNPIAISFLEEQGHRLDEHKDRGVLPEWVFAGLLRHLPFGDHSVTWITYHGDRDVGFLLRQLQAGGRGAPTRPRHLPPPGSGKVPCLLRCPCSRASVDRRICWKAYQACRGPWN